MTFLTKVLAVLTASLSPPLTRDITLFIDVFILVSNAFKSTIPQSAAIFIISFAPTDSFHLPIISNRLVVISLPSTLCTIFPASYNIFRFFESIAAFLAAFNALTH
jgi:hypothetical protein